jgi:hypothetical protein
MVCNWWCGLARDGESGQMMLLAAFVLILGFVALSGLVSRVGQLPGEITRAQADPIFLEAAPLRDLIDSVVAADGLKARSADHAAMGPEFDDSLTALLGHVQALEGAKGYVYDWAICWDAGSAFVYSVLSNAEASLAFSSDAYADPSAPVPDPLVSAAYIDCP